MSNTSISLEEPALDPVFDRYLASLRENLSVGRHATDDLIREIREHLIDAVTASSPSGTPRPEAVVAEFGPADAIGRALSEEHHRRSLAHAARRSLRWALGAGLAAATVARAAVSLDGQGGLGATDRAAIIVATTGAALSALFGLGALRAGGRANVTEHDFRFGSVACAASAVSLLVGLAAATSIGGDLLADAVRGTSTIAELIASAVGIVLVTAVASGLIPLGRAWRHLNSRQR